MYIAELHGKLSRDHENREDLLTSNVFSFLKYAPRDIFLFEYINLLGIPVTKEDTHSAKFLFWTTYNDLTEPDVVIIIGDYYLLFEAKLYSGFGEETKNTSAQIVRELKGGLAESKNIGKEFRMIAITADHFQRPEIFQDIQNELQQYLLWTNWQRFAFLLSSILESRTDLSMETRLFGSDLYSLLDKKHLRKYEGLNALSLKNYRFKFVTSIYFSKETAKYRGDFIGFSTTFPKKAGIRAADEILYYDSNRPFYSYLQYTQRMKEIPQDSLFYNGGTNG